MPAAGPRAAWPFRGPRRRTWAVLPQFEPRLLQALRDLGLREVVVGHLGVGRSEQVAVPRPHPRLCTEDTVACVGTGGIREHPFRLRVEGVELHGEVYRRRDELQWWRERVCDHWELQPGGDDQITAGIDPGIRKSFPAGHPLPASYMCVPPRRKPKIHVLLIWERVDLRVIVASFEPF